MSLIIGLLAIFFAGFFEKISFFTVNNIKYKNFLMFLYFISSSIGLFILHILIFKEFNISYFYDGIFYLILILEIGVIILYKKNYEIHSRNFSNISFSIFSSVYLIPIVSYIYFLFLPSEDNVLKLFYNNIYEALIISLVLFVLNMIYFYDKIKLKTIQRPFLLLILALVIINTMFFSIFLIQKYEGFLVYTTVFFIISIFYLIQSLTYERKDIIKYKGDIFSLKTFLFSQTRLLGVVLIQFGAKLIAIEFVTFIKRLGQIVIGFVFDKYIHKSENLIVKDIFVVFLILIFITIIFIYYY